MSGRFLNGDSGEDGGDISRRSRGEREVALRSFQKTYAEEEKKRGRRLSSLSSASQFWRGGGFFRPRRRVGGSFGFANIIGAGYDREEARSGHTLPRKAVMFPRIETRWVAMRFFLKKMYNISCEISRRRFWVEGNLS